MIRMLLRCYAMTEIYQEEEQAKPMSSQATPRDANQLRLSDFTWQPIPQSHNLHG